MDFWSTAVNSLLDQAVRIVVVENENENDMPSVGCLWRHFDKVHSVGMGVLKCRYGNNISVAGTD